MMAAERKNILQINKQTHNQSGHEWHIYDLTLEIRKIPVYYGLMYSVGRGAHKCQEGFMEGDLDLTTGCCVTRRACRMKYSAVFLFGKYSLSQHTFIT